MDSFTHIVIGACVGELLAGKQLGKKAMFIGALANSLPDIDIVASPFLSTTADLLAHRGITHSFLFLALVSPALAAACARLFRRDGVPYKKWLLFWALQVFLHIFIDAFTAYGTGWLEPFSHYRVSFNSMFVLDPLFTIGPAVAFIALLLLRRSAGTRRVWAQAGVLLSAVYTLFTFYSKWTTDRQVQQAFATAHITPRRYFTTPTPLNSLLWYVVAETDSGIYRGYRSLLDEQPGVDLRFLSRNDSLLTLATNREDLNNLLRFSRGYYTLQMNQDSLVFNDLCLGEIYGPPADSPRFVFYFYLQHPEANGIIVQRGRMAMMNKQTLALFARRVMGKK